MNIVTNTINLKERVYKISEINKNLQIKNIENGVEPTFGIFASIYKITVT